MHEQRPNNCKKEEPVTNERREKKKLTKSATFLKLYPTLWGESSESMRSQKLQRLS